MFSKRVSNMSIPFFGKFANMFEMASERRSEGLDTVNRLEISIWIQWRWSRTPKSVFLGWQYITIPEIPCQIGNSKSWFCVCLIWHRATDNLGRKSSFRTEKQYFRVEHLDKWAGQILICLFFNLARSHGQLVPEYGLNMPEYGPKEFPKGFPNDFLRESSRSFQGIFPKIFEGIF